MSNIYPLARYMKLCIDIDIKTFELHKFMRETDLHTLTYKQVIKYQIKRDDIDLLHEEAINEYKKVTCHK